MRSCGLLPGDRPPADVLAAEAAGPVYHLDCGIGAGLCLGHGLAAGGDVEDTATDRDQTVALTLRARVKDLHAIAATSFFEAADLGAFGVITRIAIRRKHHDERRIVVPPEIELV